MISFLKRIASEFPLLEYHFYAKLQAAKGVKTGGIRGGWACGPEKKAAAPPSQDRIRQD